MRIEEGDGEAQGKRPRGRPGKRWIGVIGEEHDGSG